MTIKEGALRRQAAKLTAVLLVLAVYAFARVPVASESELAKLAEDFHFSAAPLPTMSGETQRTIRNVNPSLRRVAGWISSVGAAVALNDLDSDGLPNDACYVDTRIDKVIVAPVPGTPVRYQPFTLDPRTLPYDSSTMAPMGCLPGDFNEDGLMDVLAYYWGRTPVLFLKRAGSHGLDADSYTQTELVPGNERWYTNAATLADIDGDGHTDLIIGNFFPDGARILDARANVPDEMQDSMSLAQNGGRKHLLLWKAPTPRFEEVNNVLDEQSARGWSLAIGAADLDGDLLPEIYFANDFGPDRLLHNLSTPGHPRFELLEGRRGFTTTKSKVLGHDSYNGMGVDFGDLNGDGWPDIYV
ncbi:MAG TPA: VCBS repeat-containing protein, partial [Pyrinomonadaceae bacterium]